MAVVVLTATMVADTAAFGPGVHAASRPAALAAGQPKLKPDLTRARQPRGLIPRSNRMQGVAPSGGLSRVGTTADPWCGACVPPLKFHSNIPVAGGLSGTPGAVDIVPYYWQPASTAYTTNYKSIIDGYLDNVASASNTTGNVFSTTTQYFQQATTPTLGPIQHIRYAISVAADVTDTTAFPAPVAPCPTTLPAPYTACVTDSEAQTFVTKRVQTIGNQISDASLYPLFLPQNVLSCFADSAGKAECSNTTFCAYHNAYDLSGKGIGPFLVYSVQPFPDLKACSDPNNGPQAPNGDAAADTQISMLSHETNESITDWAGAWYDANGYENGDECVAVYGPTSGTPGALYNQQIGTARYYTQDEFSNEDFRLGIGDSTVDKTGATVQVPGCIQKEETITAALTAPASPTETVAGTFTGAQGDPDGAENLDDPAHVAPMSYTWNWGDSTAAGSGQTPSHTYCSTGTFTVSLAVTDLDGWPASTNGSVTVGPHAPVVTSISPNIGAAGTVVTVNGCGFDAGAIPYFGATAGPPLGVVGSLITTAAPTHPSGTVDVTVTTQNGTSPTTLADQYMYPYFLGYFNWFDNVTPGMTVDNIHVLNPGTNTANVTISLPGAADLKLAVSPGQEQHATFPPGHIGGPVTVMSDWPILASQRVEYFGSFNEIWAMTPNQASTVSYINWFDLASPGMNGDNVHILNPGNVTANVTVTLAGGSPIKISIAAGQEQHVTWGAGRIGGPVVVNSDQPVLAASRVQYYQSFDEVLAQSPAQASTNSFFNWFDNMTPGMRADNIHVVNPGTVTANVRFTPYPFTPVSIPPGGEAYVIPQFGAIGGPIQVISDQPVLTTQRVEFYNSFNEVAGETQAQAKPTSHIMWFDRATPGMTTDNIHILVMLPSMNGSTAHVDISMPGAPTIVLDKPPGEYYVSFGPGYIGGPVTITTDGTAVAAARVQYYQTFNEVPAA